MLLCNLVMATTSTDSNNMNNIINVQITSKQNNFTVTLNANPTTGYTWKIIKYDNFLLKLISTQYIVPNTNLIGAGGHMVFTFGIQKTIKKIPANTIMTFTYSRSWEHNGDQTNKTITINFINSR